MGCGSFKWNNFYQKYKKVMVSAEYSRAEVLSVVISSEEGMEKETVSKK